MNKSVFTECLAKASSKSDPAKFLQKAPGKSVLKECLRRLPPQCLTRLSKSAVKGGFYRSVSEERLQTVFCSSVSQMGPTTNFEADLLYGFVMMCIRVHG